MEKSVYEVENAIIGSCDFAKSACDLEEYINLMHLFKHQDERYIDFLHYTEKANEIIAERICAEVIKYAN